MQGHDLGGGGNPPVPVTLDMRGWRAEAVAPALDQTLNDAFLAGMPFLRIIHGKGTGVLREVVRDILKGHPLVSGYATAAHNDGGEGVTVVTMANSERG